MKKFLTITLNVAITVMALIVFIIAFMILGGEGEIR